MVQTHWDINVGTSTGDCLTEELDLLPETLLLCSGHLGDQPWGHSQAARSEVGTHDGRQLLTPVVAA